MTRKPLFFALLLAPSLLLSVRLFGESQVSERGFKPDAVYQFNGFDTVNAFNGNLILSIPLGITYPVASGLSYSFTLRYAGQFWSEIEFCSVSVNREEDCRLRKVLERDNAGVGWAVDFGKLYKPLDTTNPYSPTGMWKYVSPDGSTHNFFPTLHDPVCGEGGVTSNCDTSDPAYRYTRDGSYLRLKIVDTATMILEFPDGVKQRYEFSDGEWSVRYIYGPFSTLSGGVPTSNYVKIDIDPNTRNWTITDSRGRLHTVTFEAIPGTARYVITGLSLAAFNNQTASYTLNQDYVDLAQPCDTTTKKPVALLSSVDLPSGESYSFTYNQAATCADDSGVLQSATLPTGGKLEWTYQEVSYSGEGTAIAVLEKTTRDQDGTAVGKTKYAITPGVTTIESYASATDATPDTKIVNYFQIDRSTVDRAAFYGLPFTYTSQPGVPADPAGRYVSSVTYDCTPSGTCPSSPSAAEKIRYVKYERDYRSTCQDQYVWCQREGDRRVISERTLYPTDNSLDSGVTYSGFDGLGHFRTQTTFGSFDGISRETHTDFNESAGTLVNGARTTGYIGIPNGASWILNTYTNAHVLENGTYVKSESCFDADTGFLKRKRLLAGNSRAARDLVTVFTPDAATGYVDSELYYGGDAHTVPYNADVCAVSLTSSSWEFKIQHSYDYPAAAGASGTEQAWYARSTGAAMPFRSSDLVLDHNTGLVSASRDPSQLTTNYSYDTSGRLTTISPPAEAATTIAYANAGVSPATVTTSKSSSTSLISRKYEYDFLGRISKEMRLLPDGSWSTRQSNYDGLSRKVAVSEEESTPAHWTSYSNFDAAGRPQSIIAPDAVPGQSPNRRETIIDYTGDRLAKRKSWVATGANESQVAVLEEYDRFGRLVKVTEDADGAAQQTAYAYDPANRLTLVTMGVQTRSFGFDGRGFLINETHPESGQTSYALDARGHIIKKVTPLATLSFSYDPAERLLAVQEGDPPANTLKVFTYDRANAGSDYSLGKMATAKRYNDAGPLGTVTVEETFTYASLGGRLSNKTTVVTPGPTFSDDYSYNNLGQLASLTYPSCSGCTMTQAAPLRRVYNTYTRGALTSVGNWARGITYHPNGMVWKVPHWNATDSGGPVDEQTIANGMARPNSLSVTNYCDGTLSITQQPQSRTVSSGSQAGLTVTASGATSYQWYSGSNQLTGQTTNTLTTTVTQTGTYWVRVYRIVSGSSCSLDSEVATVTVSSCTPPDATISAPASVAASGTASASVPSTGSTYAWSITNGTIISGSGTSSISFHAGCTGPVVLSVSVTSSCTSASDTRNVAVNVPAATVSGTATIAQGASTTIRANLTGSGPWDLTWSDGTVQNNVTTSPATRSVSPVRTTTYTLTSFSDASCPGTSSGQAVVTVTPPAPTGVSATATSTTQVSVQWSSTGTVDKFEVYRDGAKIASPTASPYVDTVAAGTAHVYYVMAVTGTTRSAASARDLATTVMFSQGVTPGVRFSAQHISELRTAVNAVRSAAGLAAATFTDNGYIRTYHITELRDALDAARAQLQLPSVSYTQPVLTAGNSRILASDVNEIRGGVQ